MDRNAGLCFLMGTSDTPSRGVKMKRPAAPEEALLYALCCARADWREELVASCAMLDAQAIEIVVAYLLMLGLSGREYIALQQFDSLKRVMPDCAPLWLALARLQASWNLFFPASRSEAVYCQLSGQPLSPDRLPSATMARSGSSRIHFLEGDVCLR